MTPRVRVDHLVYATPNLERGVEQIESLLGVRASAGGRHLGRGTHNALLALDTDIYLEIVAPDPEQSDPPVPRAFGLDGLKEPRLATCAAKSDRLDVVRARAESKDVRLGGIQNGNRRRADGVDLSWRYTDPAAIVADGLVPFFIDWGPSPHPALTAPSGSHFLELRGEHPDPASVLQQLETLGIQMSVTRAPRPALFAVIDGRRGRIELR